MEPKTVTPAPTTTQPLQPQVVVNPVVNEPKPLVKPLETKKTKKSALPMIMASLLVVLLGVTTGWFLAGGGGRSVTQEGDSSDITITKEGVKEAGVGKESDYDSTAEGILKEGGVNGEGTHYLDRELGESKYISLTSSVVDLDDFIDKKVILWGDTISVDPKRASWKIDVGLVREKEE